MDSLNAAEWPSYNPQNLQSPQSQSFKSIAKIFDKLPNHQRLALELRLDGCDYETVQSELKLAGYPFSQFYLREWFAKGGDLYEIYHEMRRVHSEERLKWHEGSTQKLKEGVSEAIAVLYRGVHDKKVSNRQMESAKEILDRSGFGRQVRQDGNMVVESESMDRMADVIDRVLSQKTII